LLLASLSGDRNNYALSSAPNGQIALLSWFNEEPGWEMRTFNVRGVAGGQAWLEETGSASGWQPVLGALRGSGFGFSFTVGDGALGWYPLGVSNADLSGKEKEGLATAM
jgi:hypothetical protein